MTDQALFLRPDIQMEPLIDRWYAWCHLIPPATAARNVTQRHFKIMESYVKAPQVHALAAKDPKLLGGPFIDHGGQRVDEIRDLWQQTVRLRAPQLELSAALQTLDHIVRTAADGHSMSAIYPQVPDALRGYVELVYDLNQNPSFRLLEPLLYHSRYYDESAQSLMLSVTSGDDRPFVLSTPRLDTSDSVHLSWPFGDERVDELFRLKTTPQPWRGIEDRLGFDNRMADRFRSFLTPEPPPRYEPYTGAGLRWRYFGHACILIETKHLTILFDPVLSYTYESNISRYTYADLPERIDYVCITHNHIDHILLETLLQIRSKVGDIVVPRSGVGALQDPSLKLALEHIGFSNVRELGELEAISVPGGSIMGVPFLGEHADLAIATKLAYVVRLGHRQLMFAADSCNVEPRIYEHLHALIGDVGTLFLGMECDGAPLSWLYGPLLLEPIERSRDQSRRLSGSDYSQAIGLVERFNCRDIYVYAMGQEPWLNYVMSIKYSEQSRPIVESTELIGECLARGLTAQRLFGEKEILLD